MSPSGTLPVPSEGRARPFPDFLLPFTCTCVVKLLPRQAAIGNKSLCEVSVESILQSSLFSCLLLVALLLCLTCGPNCRHFAFAITYCLVDIDKSDAQSRSELTINKMMACQSYLLCFVTFAILILVTVVVIFVIDDVDKWAEKGTVRAACNRSSSSFDPDFELAAQESFGFFDDISSSDWAKLKEKVRAMSPNFNTWYLPHVDSEGKPRGDNRNRQPGYFYQSHYEPDFVCQYERRIGKLGDGGKWICDPHRIAQQKDCLVYSVGSNNDFSFEEAVLREIGPHCEIHTFDFGNYAAGAEKVGTRLRNGVNRTAVVYHQVGVGLDDPPKFKSLKTIVEELGHVNRIIDIFKIDCEGCEWETSSHWFEAPVFLRQIQVELHKSDVQRTPQFFDLLYEQNYVITHKEPNIAYSGPNNLAIEYAFLKLDPAFNHGFERPKGAALPPKETEVGTPPITGEGSQAVAGGGFPEDALLQTAGEVWKLVDFTDGSFRGELNYTCEFVPFRSTKDRTAEICVHTARDLVSNRIRQVGRWGDCDVLPRLWEESVTGSGGEVYVEIGANIGSCVVEMLLSTDANIVAFEPHPMNQICLHRTLARLGPEYQKRVALVPVALGGQRGVSQIYTGEGNMGNSVVGKAIKDFPKQTIVAPVDIRIERLDSILSDEVVIPLVKMDAQGFECQVLDGTSRSVANHVRTIKFEMASKWLRQQNCLDLLPRLRQLNFNVTNEKGDVVDTDQFNCGICDLYARSNI